MNKKIQILRAFAICAVVLIHTNIGGYPGVIIRPFINFAVAMFFFVSGYLTKTEIPDLKAFYLKRISRVMIPYVIWSVIYTAASGSYTMFVKNILTANCCGPFYYIFVYVQFVLLTPVIGRLAKSRFSGGGNNITSDNYCCPLCGEYFQYSACVSVSNGEFSCMV